MFSHLPKGTRRKWYKNGVRTLILIIAALLAIVGGNVLQIVLAFIGAFCCAPLALFFPAMMHMTIVGGSTWRMLLNYFLMLLGAAVFVLSTSVSIKSAIDKVVG